MTNTQVPEPHIARISPGPAIPGGSAFGSGDAPSSGTPGSANEIRGAITAPPVCDTADIALAHQQMRIHRGCRIERCAWKAAAFHTLVQAGRLVPQSLSPRLRAAIRGIAFPALDHEPPPIGGPTSHTLRTVLAKLDELATPPPGMRHTAYRPPHPPR